MPRMVSDVHREVLHLFEPFYVVSCVSVIYDIFEIAHRDRILLYLSNLMPGAWCKCSSNTRYTRHMPCFDFQS